MNDFLDQQQAILADAISGHEQNTVGHFMKQIFNLDNNNINNKDVKGYASGGAVDTLSSTNDNSDQSLVQRIANSATKTINGADSQASGKYGDSPLGTGFYNSAPYIAQHFTQLGKFFSGSEPGNFYTNRYEQPTKEPSAKSTSPNDYYSQWYEGMRRFAEAEEVANHGQTTVRSR